MTILESTIGIPSSLGGLLKEVDPSSTIDNIFTFEFGGKKWSRVFDSGISSFRASWLDTSTDLSSRLIIVLGDVRIKEIILDVPITIAATIDFSGKTLCVSSGGLISGPGKILNAWIDVSISTKIFNSILNLDPTVKNAEIKAGWFGASPTSSDNGGLIQGLCQIFDRDIILDEAGTYICNSNLNGEGKGRLVFRSGTRLGGNGYITNINVSADFHQIIFESSLNLLTINTNTDFSIKWIGCLGNGLNDDSPALNTISGSTNFKTKRLVVPKSSGSYVLGSNVTFATNSNENAVKTLYFEEGAKFVKKDGAGEVRIQGAAIDAPLKCHIIDKDLTLYNCYPAIEYFSAMWYGAGFDSNSTIAVQKSNDNAAERFPIYFPAGTYPVDGPFFTTTVIGEGRGTIFTYASDGTTGYILRFGRHKKDGDGSHVKVSNFVINGLGSSAYGLGFYNGGVDDEFSGKWSFEYIMINNCVRSINKSFGNFGNTFWGCEFKSSNHSSEFHYRAEDISGVMHTGLDDFSNCRFSMSTCAAVYINDEEGGGTRFQKCIFEYNRGFDIFVAQSGANVAILPIIFDQCWLEGDSKNFPVTIDGNIYSQPYEFYFNSAHNVVLRDCTLGRMILKNRSFVKVRGGAVAYALGQHPTNVDESSYLQITESVAGFNAASNSEWHSNGLQYQPKGTSFSRSPFPSSVISASNLALKVSFSFIDPYQSDYYGAGASISVESDNQLVSKCTQFSNSLGAVGVAKLSFTSLPGKWYVTSCGIKIISGTRVRFYQTGPESGFALDSTFGIKPGEWEYWYCIRQAKTAALVTTEISPLTTNDAIFRVSCYQVLEFETYSQCADFIKQKVFIDNSKFISKQVSLDFPATLSGNTNVLTVSVDGASEGDSISLGVPFVAQIIGVIYTAYVSSTNNITISCTNITSSTVNPPPSLFTISIVKY